MTPHELRRLIETLPMETPITQDYEETTRFNTRSSVWYDSQKEHWLGWLAGYYGPGAYGRKNANRDARFVYNHFQCPPGLLWLAEAAGVDDAQVVEARDAMLAAGKPLATQCAAFRRIVTWEDVLAALQRLEAPPAQPAFPAAGVSANGANAADRFLMGLPEGDET